MCTSSQEFDTPNAQDKIVMDDSSNVFVMKGDLTYWCVRICSKSKQMPYSYASTPLVMLKQVYSAKACRNKTIPDVVDERADVQL